MTTTEQALCKEWILSEWGRSHPCNRKVKEDGLCGLHLGVRNRRDARRAAWRAERDRINVQRDRSRDVALRLYARTGIHFQHSAEGVWLTPLTAEALLERINHLASDD